MKKTVRHGLRIACGILLLFIIGSFIMYVLVSANKEEINALARAQINKQVKGIVTIGDLELNFFRTFPMMAVELTDVSLRDSLWEKHHRNFLKAETIYIRFQPLSLFRGKPKINSVMVRNSSIYLYTDSCGYCNLNRAEDLGFKKDKADIPDLQFEQTRITVENQALNSYHDIEIDNLKCHLAKIDSGYIFKIALKSLVHSIGFNMAKGSYLADKSVEGNFYLNYFPGNKIEFSDVKMKIDQQPFLINGSFYFYNTPMTYDLSFQTKKVLYKKAAGLLTQSLQKKLEPIDIIQPFDVNATISGYAGFRVIPIVNVHFQIKDSEMNTPAGKLVHCSFTGSFTNQMEILKAPEDKNSKFIFDNIEQTWENITFTSTHAEVSNLKTPYLICDVRSNIDLTNLNALAESSSIRFVKGLGNLNINYNGSIAKDDTLNSLVNGTFTLTDAEINYLPRNLVFRNCSGVIAFKDQDLIISNLIASTGSTNLTMNGGVTNLLALLDKNPEQLIMNWNISTPDLNLSDFISYVSERAQVTPQKKPAENKIIKVAENIDRMLRDGIAHLNISAEKMKYKKFAANHVAGAISLVGNKVILKKVKLNHSGGTLSLQGTLTNGNHGNQLDLESTIGNADIPGIFYAFDNFGQDAITHQNMKGRLSAKITMKGVITDKAEVYPNSMKGMVEFSVKDGELINFEPAMKIAATALKKRDFSHILFGELTNEIEINGSAITLHKMEIRSNVVILFVEGIYDTKKGTDMSIQVPLSNLSKAENEVLDNTGRVGMNVRLRAKTGEDGKLKVSWDPFNSASKQRKTESKKDSLRTQGLYKK
ncbi:MAG TPA: AsmA-like C-terminal region-containing protein [Saprospiraceae bacterium]|nr:AsmA-like C-terminal region-containing protein [Saprospiraceae bacterium]